MSEHKTNGAGKHESLDAVVIGTGVAGLYQLYKLRDEQGLLDTASGVGGTWYWIRYPGARFDSEAYIYQYLFSEKLYKGWSWSERFPGQPEIEKWLNYVADELDLRNDIRFSTTITSAVYNEACQRWTITTDTGCVIDAQFLITCCRMLSAPLTSVFPGQETFKGTLVHTGRWPKGDLDLADKRVGIVGNGATGIQVIQTIASEVGSLKVFARTPQYIIPPALDQGRMAEACGAPGRVSGNDDGGAKTPGFEPGRTGACAREQRLRQHHPRQREDAWRNRNMPSCRRHVSAGAAARRDRHRQGDFCARYPCGVAAARPPVRGGQLRLRLARTAGE
jgi:Flavin-binding monooxygenase-like